jgi:hypothetical protein
VLKRKIILLGIFSIIVLCSIIYFLPGVHGLNYTVFDPEDDVFQDCDTAENTGDYHDEIDIVELTVAGQYVNLTVAGNLANWNSSYFGEVFFAQSIMVGAYNSILFSPPYYALDWGNESGPIEVTLEKGYSLGGNNFAYEVWNGTGWEDRITATPFNIAFDITAHSVISYIPDGVEEIPSNMKVLGSTHIFIVSGCGYSDLTNVPSSGGAVPSYNLFIIICTMLGISLLIIKKYNR